MCTSSGVGQGGESPGEYRAKGKEEEQEKCEMLRVEWFLIECRKNKTKLINNLTSANLKP